MNLDYLKENHVINFPDGHKHLKFNPEFGIGLDYLDVRIKSFDDIFLISQYKSLVPACDTFDFWNVLTNVLPILKEEILSREGKLVIRPDSSPKTPYEILVGDLEAEEGTPEFKGAVEMLWDLFGGTITEQGYKVLDSHIGMIYGDSIILELAEKINKGLKDKGFASVNWVGGLGSFSFNYRTRDSLGFAMKATFGVVSGENREIFKDPKTDKGEKKSAKGLLSVFKEGGDYKLKDQSTWDEVLNCEFEVVFQDGKLFRDDKLHDIRSRLDDRRDNKL